VADFEYINMYSDIVPYSGDGTLWGGPGRGKGRLLDTGLYLEDPVVKL
jgi:hypothetical protein